MIGRNLANLRVRVCGSKYQTFRKNNNNFQTHFKYMLNPLPEPSTAMWWLFQSMSIFAKISVCVLCLGTRTFLCACFISFFGDPFCLDFFHSVVLDIFRRANQNDRHETLVFVSNSFSTWLFAARMTVAFCYFARTPLVEVRMLCAGFDETHFLKTSLISCYICCRCYNFSSWWNW